MKGHFTPHSIETKRRLSELNIGKKLSEETKKKISESHNSKETSKKWSELRKGQNHYNWQGGINSINDTIRHSFEIREWRKSVFERDNYTCVECGIRGGNLEADHIKSFALYPELRFVLGNGRTLCRPCHRKTNTYGSKTRREVAREVS